SMPCWWAAGSRPSSRWARRRTRRGRCGGPTRAGPPGTAPMRAGRARAGHASRVAYAAVTHPTERESSSKGDKAKLAAATAKLLQNWNAALDLLSPAIQHPDAPVALTHYGSAWADGDRVAVPEADFPAGLPSWMHERDGWAARV